MEKKYIHLWIWTCARPEIVCILLQTLLNVIMSLTIIWFALISRQVVDIATGMLEGDLWQKSGLLIVILLFQAVCSAINHLLQARTAGRVEMRIRERVFSSIFRKKWQAVNPYSSGDILHRLTGDVTVTVSGITNLLPQAVSMCVRLIACGAVLLMMDTLFAGIILAVGALLFLCSRLYSRHSKRMHTKCQESEADTRFFMQECVEDWTVVQSFDMLSGVRHRLAGLQRTNYRYKLRRAGVGAVTGGTLYLLFSGCYYVALAWGAWRLMTGVISFGTLTAFLQIVQQMQAPFRNMSGLLPQYYNMLASAERLMELEDLPDELPALPLPENMDFTALTVSGLHFTYDRMPVFENAELTVRRGEFVALTGSSGIGKSTFFRLLLGFLEPMAGEICCQTTAGPLRVGGMTRRLFSYVPQGSLLLSGTIRQNLTLGCPEAEEDALWAAVDTAALGEYIRSLPQGLDTPLGERGLGFSEGQLQRLAIARGLLRGAPVLLLDEATAALDAETERQVLAALHALPDMTCICITHRDTALAMCDRALRIRNGRFEEVSYEKA